MTRTMMPDCRCSGLTHGHQNGCPPVELLDLARQYAATSEWTFAKTMPDNPHWYVVRQRAWATSTQAGEGHEALFQLIRWFYALNWFKGRAYRSIQMDGHLIWIMEDGTVINRKPLTAD